MTERSITSRATSIIERIFSNAIVQSIVRDVGERTVKEMSRHFMGIGTADENLLRNSEVEVEKEMAPSFTPTEAQEKMAHYRQWLEKESFLPNEPDGTEPELKWRAKMWGLIATTNSDPIVQRNIIRGLVKCDTDEDREKYLMTSIIGKPISLKIIDWLKKKWTAMSDWLHSKFGPNVIAGLWNKIEEAVRRIYDDIVQFLGDDFVPWLMEKAVETERLQKGYRGWLKKNGGISIFGNWMTNGPFNKVEE